MPEPYIGKHAGGPDVHDGQHEQRCIFCFLHLVYKPRHKRYRW